MDAIAPARTLTVCSRWGLANRLRVLLSGMILAEATGRQFTMFWPRHDNCGAVFEELFTNRLNVIDRDLPQDTPIYGLYLGGAPWRDFLAAEEKDLVILSGAWVLNPNLYPTHKPLKDRCAGLLDTLQPIPYIQDTVAAFRTAHFRPHMIGVHLRRGDWNQAESRDNLHSALAAVDAFLEQSPEAGILLCTDDGAPNQLSGRPTAVEGITSAFRRRYGNRLVHTEPRSLDRRTVQGVQDALIDFLLLRATDDVAGTQLSSFSSLAAFGRNVPLVMCGSSGAQFGAKRLLAIATGVYPLIKLAGFVQYHRNVPFSQLSVHYGYTLRRAAARWRRPAPK